MNSLRQTIAQSWAPHLTILTPDLPLALGLAQPISLRALMSLLRQREESSHRFRYDGDGWEGAAELTIRSDGSYVFSGNLRATGFTSHAFKIRAMVRSGVGAVVVREVVGTAYGTDTPGERQADWRVEGVDSVLQTFWMVVRREPVGESSVTVDLAGSLGTGIDVVSTAAQLFAASKVAGPLGVLVMLGASLGSRNGGALVAPSWIGGVTLGAGAMLLFGTNVVMVAAFGTGMALGATVSHRRLLPAERELAIAVFGSSLDLERIRLTDLHHPRESDGIAREFTIPVIDGSIVIGMGDNFANPLGPDVSPRPGRGCAGGSYRQPGQLLIHELAHAWQIQHTEFSPCLIGHVVGSRDYCSYSDSVARRDDWSSFTAEQQATIVSDWYVVHRADLNGAAATQDLRFHYIAHVIRAL